MVWLVVLVLCIAADASPGLLDDIHSPNPIEPLEVVNAAGSHHASNDNAFQEKSVISKDVHVEKLTTTDSLDEELPTTTSGEGIIPENITSNIKNAINLTTEAYEYTTELSTSEPLAASKEVTPLKEMKPSVVAKKGVTSPKPSVVPKKGAPSQEPSVVPKKGAPPEDMKTSVPRKDANPEIIRLSANSTELQMTELKEQPLNHTSLLPTNISKGLNTDDTQNSQLPDNTSLISTSKITDQHTSTHALKPVPLDSLETTTPIILKHLKPKVAMDDVNNPTSVVYAPIAIAIIVLFAIVVSAIVLTMRKLKDVWSRRHYARMDFLIDGMYDM